MKSYTFLAVLKDKELYLTNITPVEFTENFDEVLKFESENSAKSKLYSRFLSLSNWISSKKEEKIKGIFLVTLEDDCIKERERFL